MTEKPSNSPEQIEQELDRIARVAAVMLDGDACRRIVTPRALEYMFKTDPQDRFLAGDNYDVNDAEFNAVKKILIRLSRLAPFACDVNLWMPIPGHPEKIQVVIRNAHEMSQFWVFGAIYQDLFPPMKTVLESGQRVTVKQRPGMISVLAPVYDSLGEVAGLVEVVSHSSPPAHEDEM
ncbi:MAG TPA: hypothetical protein VFQ24_14340 [Terriglobia bacterium]|nr:hypothetical protein [Terriglobia bacterium]